MATYYPQASVILRVIWEDFNLKSDAALQEVYTLPILARSVTVNINDYSQADTFNCEIDYKQFPFDPRAIRACGISIAMQDTKTIFNADNSLRVIEPTSENTVFQGFVDEESIDFDDTKRTVKLEGRDFTALLIDRKYTGGALDLGQSLDTILEGLLAQLKEAASIILDNRIPVDLPTGTAIGATLTKTKISNGSTKALAHASPTSTKAPKLGGKRSQNSNETYWDVIQDLVSRAGLIAYIELDKLVLTKPRALYDRNAAKQFVYGRNITDLSFKRQLGRKKNFNVNVRSLNLQTKEVLVAEIPQEASDAWASATGIPQKRVQIPTVNSDGSKGDPKDAPVIGFRVPNVNNKAQLIEIGENIYEEIGRQQIEGSFKTKDLETASGTRDKPGCFNLLKLRNGTPLNIKIDQGDLEGINKLDSVDKKTKFLINRCFDRRVAHVLAQTLSNPRFNTPFYTKSVQFTLDADTGLSIKVDFLNFIETPERLKGNG